MSEFDKLGGMELAAAVAKARGWKYHDMTWIEDHPGVRMWHAPTELYRPDSDIAQAWELVDVLWDDKKDFSISKEDADLWWVEIHDLDWYDKETNHTLVAEMMRGTAPEVICRAFLKAKAASR